MELFNLFIYSQMLILTLFLSTFLLSTTSFSQIHTNLGLPDGAKARFGKGRIHHVRYCPDGKRLAVATSIGIWIYDGQTGEALKLLTEHTEPITSIEFSPNGKTFATGSEDNIIQIWDAHSYKHKATCIGHENHVNLIAYSPTGETLASTSKDETLRYWNVHTGQLQRTIKEKDINLQDIYAMAYSYDGKMLLTINSNQDETHIVFWEAQAGEYIKTISLDGLYKVAAFSMDHNILAIVGKQDRLELWDFEAGKHLRNLENRTSKAQSMMFSRDGKKIITGGEWEQVDIWDVDTGKHLKSLEHAGTVNSVTYSPDEKSIASGSEDETIRIWDVATGNLLKTITGHIQSEFYSTTYSPDGKTLLWGAEGKIYVWNAHIGELITTRIDPDCNVFAIQYSPNGKLYATGGTSHPSYKVRSVRLWDSWNGRFLGSLTGNVVTTSSIAISPDNRTLASSNLDNNLICIWEFQSDGIHPIGASIATFDQHTENVNSVAFSPDGKTLASGSKDKTIRLWDMDTHTHIKTFTGHEAGINAVEFSPDGNTIASASNDGTVRLWNKDTDDVAILTVKNTGFLISLTYSPDGKTIISGNDINAIYVWNTQTHEHISTLMGHTQSINAVEFSPNDATLVSVSQDGTVIFWDFATLIKDTK